MRGPTQLPEIELRRAPHDISVHFFRSTAASTEGRRVYVVKVIAKVPDSHTGRMDYFGTTDHIELAPRHRITSKKVARWARDLLRRHFEHEIDEWLHVDGVCMFDPHTKPDQFAKFSRRP